MDIHIDHTERDMSSFLSVMVNKNSEDRTNFPDENEICVERLTSVMTVSIGAWAAKLKRLGSTQMKLKRSMKLRAIIFAHI